MTYFGMTAKGGGGGGGYNGLMVQLVVQVLVV